MEEITIGLDAGHGGKDRTNRGPTGYVEADGNLRMAQMLKLILEGTGAFRVVMTREDDTFLEIRKRANILADAKCDLALSLHTNALNTKVRGTECFYSVDLPADKDLAGKISARIAARFGVTNRGAKAWAASPTSPGQSGATASNPEDHLAFVDQAQDRGIKHVLLLEGLFHDNPQDEALLKNPDNLKLMMEDVAEEICRFYGVERLTPVQRAIKAINQRLVQRGAPPLDETLWTANAVRGTKVDGGLVAALLDRMTKLL